jgi:hypothetical protein
MEHHRMLQNVLLAEHHGTLTHPATRCIILLLNLQNKLDIKERGQRRWSHQFMFAHKSVPHLSSQCALACLAKTLSFHNMVKRNLFKGLTI